MAEDMEIGEIRKYNGKLHKCVNNSDKCVSDSDKCDGCSYRYKSAKFCKELYKHLGNCVGNGREDGEDVVFVILAD